MDIFKLKNLGIFAGGVLFGTAGVKVLPKKYIQAVLQQSFVQKTV